ncbi:MAG: alpha-L-arabinofuranosidase C-terminal domain-containing protein, partial [Planctomycetota bacterium]
MQRKVLNLSMLLILALLVIGSSRCAEEVSSENPVPNSSFEISGEKGPLLWRQIPWQGRGDFGYARKARSGKRSVMIASEKGADASWQARVPVKMYSRYRLTGWIRTENVRAGTGKGALLNLHNIQPRQTRAITGTNDWTKVELVFDTNRLDVLEVNCLFGGWGLSTGKAWFDDLRLEIMSTKKLKPEVTLLAANTGPPISKYIYGQFIEHLGRCIYGGIWAEMLEDRKFYYPVGEKESPWKTMGDKAQVRMKQEGACVGEHTPEILLPGNAACGIVQEGLGLKQGKEYTGRVVIAGREEAGPVEVRLCWGDGEGDRQTVTIDQIMKNFEKHPFRFTAEASTDNGRLEILGLGKGALRVGTASLMPADHDDGFRPDTLKLMKELNAPIYRWPGGNFVSGYDWKDGLGDRDRRPPRKNPAWKGIEHNDVGIHEFIALCRKLKTEPFVTVNTGLGSIEAAAEEVEYANGPPDSPMGRLRAANGHPDPFDVKWWAIGNEMYGNWQLGHMPLEEYVKKHNQVVDAMREKDPSIQSIAVGHVGKWSESMLSHCTDHMEMISEHFYCQEQAGLSAHVAQIPENVKRIADAHRKYREKLPALAGKNIAIAMDEWNYWYGDYVYGELGTRYFLKDALGISAGLHEFFRNSDIIQMANYAQTVNVIGCIKTDKTSAAFATTGLALKLYRSRFGTIP